MSLIYEQLLQSTLTDLVDLVTEKQQIYQTNRWTDGWAEQWMDGQMDFLASGGASTRA